MLDGQSVYAYEAVQAVEVDAAGTFKGLGWPERCQAAVAKEAETFKGHGWPGQRVLSRWKKARLPEPSKGKGVLGGQNAYKFIYQKKCSRHPERCW
jgi:hypothetical protein